MFHSSASSAFTIKPSDLFQLKNTSEIINIFRHMVGLPRREISSTQGLYLHGTAQYRNIKINIHASSGTRIHDPRVRVTKAHSLKCAATVIGKECFHFVNLTPNAL
jgi:hypothetical protein